jgi:hypothetical protein
MFGDVIKKIQKIVGYESKPADDYGITIDVVMPEDAGSDEERITQIADSELEIMVDAEGKQTEENPLVRALRLQREEAFRVAYPSSGVCYGGCDAGVYNQDIAVSHGAVPFYMKLANQKQDQKTGSD